VCARLVSTLQMARERHGDELDFVIA